MGLQQKNKIDASFSMSSMTDIIFLLLIFFMLTSSFITPSGLSVNLPSSETSDIVMQEVTVSVTKDLQFSGIWSNPPIRIGKKELHELLLMWLPRLQKDAEAFLVVQKNLGSDSLQKWLTEELSSGYQVSRHTSIKTYRVLRIKKLT